mgnify:CR=1 FL=1
MENLLLAKIVESLPPLLGDSSSNHGYKLLLPHSMGRHDMGPRSDHSSSHFFPELSAGRRTIPKQSLLMDDSIRDRVLPSLSTGLLLFFSTPILDSLCLSLGSERMERFIELPRNVMDFIHLPFFLASMVAGSMGRPVAPRSQALGNSSETFVACRRSRPVIGSFQPAPTMGFMDSILSLD